MTLKEKKEKRAGLVVQMRALLNTAGEDSRDLTAEETTSYEGLEREVDALGREIDREDSLLLVENRLRAQRDSQYRAGGAERHEDGRPRRFSAAYRETLFNAKNSYARVGKNGLNSEYLNVLAEGSDAEGGYLVPEEFETTLIENLVNADPITAAADVINTRSDRHIPFEEDAGSFGYIGESGTYGTSDPSVGRVTLGAHKNGGIVKVSEELLQDAFFDLESYLQRLATRRYNELDQTSFANGDGLSKPLGLFQVAKVGTRALSGFQGAASASPAVTGDDLIETFHALPRAYRDRATWISSDTMTKMIRKLKGEDNQYLWQPGLVAGQPDQVLGRPWRVSDGAPAPAISGKSIVLGDLMFYRIVNRLGMQMQRLSELYAASGQVGFRFSRRHDGALVNAKALVYFQHGAAS